MVHDAFQYCLGIDYIDSPLAGFLVVDLTRQLAGPTSTRILADCGARVIKVEQKDSKGDTVAANPQFAAQVWHSKERITLDLYDKDGDLELLHQLLAKADVLVENFKPGVMKAMGLDWPVVHARHPHIIMTSVSGFGQTGGPDGVRPAMDVVIQAMCGMMEITGFDDKPPAGAGVAIADLTSGMYAAIGTMAALLGRQTSGVGAYVDVAMLDSMAAIMSSVTVRQLAGVFDKRGYPRTTGSRSTAPFGIYPCSDGAYIAIIGVQPHYYASLCEVIGRPEMATDPRFKNSISRASFKNKPAFNQMLEEALSHKPMREWVQLLQAAGVPCGPVNNLAGAVEEPQLQHRNMIVESEDGLKLIGNPVKISGYADPPKRSALDLAHTDIHTILARL
eukprot:g2694.t1